MIGRVRLNSRSAVMWNSGEIKEWSLEQPVGLLTSPPPTVSGTLHTPLGSSLQLWLDRRGWPPPLCRLHHQNPFLTGGSPSCSSAGKPSRAVWLFTSVVNRFFRCLHAPVAVKSTGSSAANLLLHYGAKDTLTTSNRHKHTLTHTHTQHFARSIIWI